MRSLFFAGAQESSLLSGQRTEKLRRRPRGQSPADGICARMARLARAVGQSGYEPLESAQVKNAGHPLETATLRASQILPRKPFQGGTTNGGTGDLSYSSNHQPHMTHSA
jgi:hypothetical protein